MPDSGKLDLQTYQNGRVNQCPGHGSAGRHPSRETLDRLAGHDDPGKFGRMFPELSPLDVPEDQLKELAQAMKDSQPEKESLDNEEIPGGFTYLGQFLDHGITLDLAPLSGKKRDPEALMNFRTPVVDLDNLYGLGPDGSPHMYRRNAKDATIRGPELLLGENQKVESVTVKGELDHDLPRSREGMALIGDHRNDENLLVAQTHLAFMKFHNKVCEMLRDKGMEEDDIFAEARRIVTWHFQHIVLHDWVERLCGEGTVSRILKEGRKFYRFKTRPYMPVEFSVAAYRLGHSMVRQTYSFNAVFEDADFSLLFGFTGQSGQILGDRAADVSGNGPFPVRSLPSNWIIDWRRFHELEKPKNIPRNPSRRLDPLLVDELHTLPNGGGNLAERNLKRGVKMGLPSGQDVAAEMGIDNPLSPDEIASGPDGQVAEKHGLHKATPLWYYILKEAQVREDGKRLGSVGAAIVAETLVGLVHGNQESYLWEQGPGWTPELPVKEGSKFTMADMLRFVGDVNPVQG